jgi:tRNA dimethylallyltransferase
VARPRIVCLVGPTAAGKTALGLELAEGFGLEVISADARQVYRGLDVGTAKPTPGERARVRHHCLDLVEPDERFDAARFADAALAAAADVLARGRGVLVVGGTGLYLRALLHGLCPAPGRSTRVRGVLARMAERDGTAVLHRRLGHVDPAAAARIHPHDAVRIVRALEVALVSGRRLSDWQADHGFRTARFDALVIGLAVPTPILDARIAARVDAMLAQGWLDEVRRLAARGYAADAPAWRTLGYGEMRAVVDGRRGLPDAVASTVLATRRFAKRQRTWFRREAGVVWRDAATERTRVADDVAAFLGGRNVAKGEGPE